MDRASWIWLAVGGIVLAVFVGLFLHALAWLRKGKAERSGIYLSASHAKRRLVSAGLMVFTIAWLALGATLLRRTLRAARGPFLGMLYILVLAAALLALLALAYLDFREVAASYRCRGRKPSDLARDTDQKDDANADGKE